MTTQRGQPLARDHPEGLALQMIVRYPRHLIHLCQNPDSIWRTFLEQFVLVIVLLDFVTDPTIITILNYYIFLPRNQDGIERIQFCSQHLIWLPIRFVQ